MKFMYNSTETMSLYSNVVLPTIDLISGNDRERAHHKALFFLQMCGLPIVRDILAGVTQVKNETKVFGLTFPNPVGIAAGFDKSARALKGIEAFGFGFAEIGTVTPLPQPGNPKPRLFRLKEDEAVINRMGFNSEGADVVAKRLAGHGRLGIPVGANVGKNKDTPLENAADDYVKGVKAFYALADYLTINTSSPNTKDLRRLQEKEKLAELLDRVREAVKECAGDKVPKPVLLKVAPDLTIEELDDVLSVCEGRVQGIIIGNTTIARPDHLRSPLKGEVGGLSGRPLTKRALELVAYAHQKAPNLPIVGVGGIFTPDDAARMFEAGASLVQLYSALVFEGPFLGYRINRELKRRLDKSQK